MWFSAPVFERFREGVKDFYDVMFKDGGDDNDSECGGDEEKMLGDSNENLVQGGSSGDSKSLKVNCKGN